MSDWQKRVPMVILLVVGSPVVWYLAICAHGMIPYPVQTGALALSAGCVLLGAIMSASKSPIMKRTGLAILLVILALVGLPVVGFVDLALLWLLGDWPLLWVVLSAAVALLWLILVISIIRTLLRAPGQS